MKSRTLSPRNAMKTVISLICFVAIALVTTSCGSDFRYTRGVAQLRFLLEPGFTGKLRIVDDPKRTLKEGIRKDEVMTCTQDGDTMVVPTGLVRRGTKADDGLYGHRGYSVVEVLDKTGKVLSRGHEPPENVFQCRGITVVSPEGRSSHTDVWFVFE